MEPIAWINELNFKNGLKVPLKKDSIVVFVGPNNSGKSRVLKEIEQSFGAVNPTNVILEALEMSAEGSASDFLNKIENRRKGDTYFYHQGHNSGIGSHNLKSNWEGATQGNQLSGTSIRNFVLKYLSTAERLDLVAPAENIDAAIQVQTHPIQVLKENGDKEIAFSKYFEQAFGEEAIVNHAAGAKVPLHVGKRPVATAEHDRVSKLYQVELRKLPLLHEQGDGMKGFAGVFLTLFANDFSINLIDEPEAFLHPPQAALLGQVIAQKIGENKQVILATHSEHFLKGLLDSASDRLIIIRLQREATTNKVAVLENKKLKDIWTDPLLRHSNILDGLFHKKVVLAESDSDCQFYNAISAAIVENEKKPSPDVLFVQSGGKHRFPVVIRALKALEVPLTVVGDFDFYHDENPTKFVFEELGGVWDAVKSDFQKVKKAIDEKRPELEVEALKKEIEKVFDSFTDRAMPENKIKEIQAALRKSSPWLQAKASGAAYLPSGEDTKAFARVQLAFREKNIHIIELGEIEAFDKSVGGHGPKWVNQVLGKGLIAAPELEDARNFVRSIIPLQ